MASLFRAARRAFIVTLKTKAVSPFAYLTWLIFPALFALVALFLLSSSGPARVAYGVLGGGIVGFWSAAYIDGGQSIQDERWQGTLEQIFAVPTPLAVIIVGKIGASLALGMLSFFPNLAIAFFGFHAALPGLDPLRFAISFTVLTFGFFAIALMLTPLFSASRWAFTLLNGVELGVYAVSGFMFPVTELPSWLQPLSSVLSPTWAVRALYASASPHPQAPFGLWWLASCGISCVYLAIGVAVYRVVEVRARVSGDLALA